MRLWTIQSRAAFNKMQKTGLLIYDRIRKNYFGKTIIHLLSRNIFWQKNKKMPKDMELFSESNVENMF